MVQADQGERGIGRLRLLVRYMSLELAQRYRYRRIESMVGIGGTADVDGRVASADRGAFDGRAAAGATSDSAGVR